MNAPLPNLTLSTSRSRFSASFLHMMLATMGPRRHGAGDVTQRIKFFVCQTNLGCLSNHKNADALELFDRARSIQVHIEARNAFEFIKRAASISNRVRKSLVPKGHHRPAAVPERVRSFRQLRRVECLSTLGGVFGGYSKIWPLSSIALVRYQVSMSLMPRKKIAIASALIW